MVRLANERPVVILTGARQTGKTSLLRRLFPQYGFVSLDLPSEAELAERQPEEFLRRNPPPLFVDEVQYAPSLFRYLKVAVDRKRSTPGQFLLSGSQKFVLMSGVSDSLAGRAEVVELEPLSCAEVWRAHSAMAVEDVMLRGGYPELYQNTNLDNFSFYRSYVATCLERDVRTLLAVSSLRDFERFMRACALRSAQMLNKADLARDVGISPSTAGDWLSVLQTSGHVVLLEPWFSNRTKSLVKSPKLYFCDTGLLATLLDIRNREELLRSPLIGGIWETLVFAELRKLQTAASLHWTLHYWRDRAREVDFLVHRGGQFELFEAKWAERPEARDADNLREVRELLGREKVVRETIVCRAPRSYPMDERIQATPLRELS
ncbi:MAG: ATP-binding protein [Bryobacteraceae bacterium]